MRWLDLDIIVNGEIRKIPRNYVLFSSFTEHFKDFGSVTCVPEPHNEPTPDFDYIDYNLEAITVGDFLSVKMGPLEEVENADLLAWLKTFSPDEKLVLLWHNN